jgi:membrane protein
MSAAEQPRGPTSWPLRLARWPVDLLRTLQRVIPQAIDGFFTDRCAQHAAGIAYRVLFSLVPLSIVLVAIFGIVLRNDSLRTDVVNEIIDALAGNLSDSGKAEVTRAIEGFASPATGVGLVSLLVFGWAATGMMASLRAGLEVAMRVDRGRPAVRGKLVDVILIVGAAALILGVVLLNLAAQVLSSSLQQPLERLGLDGSLMSHTMRLLVPLALTTGVVLLVYRFVPARRLRINDALAGAILTAVLLLLISLASGLVVDRTRRFNAIYGSLTIALVFLYSIYLYASALLLGAEVAAAWSRPAEGPGEPLGRQLRRVVLGLFVHQEPLAGPPSRQRVPTDPAP